MAMPTEDAAYLETDAAYPEFKTDPIRLAGYCNGVILTHDRVRRQINKKGAPVRGLS